MKLMLIISVLLSNVMMTGCTKGGSDGATISSADPKSNLNKTLMLQLVNEVRASGCNCGSTAMPPVNAVQWNDQLAAAASAHSTDMNTNDYFSHTGLNNSSPGDRITAAGYTWKTYGENIAQGAPDERQVIEGWLQSEPHCRNIMNGNFREMGVAKSGSYWTQVFGAR